MSKLTCFVCLRKFAQLPDDNLTSSYQPRLLSSPPTSSEENLYTRFLHVCTRHLKLTSLPLINGREDNEVFCPECKCLVSCLCDLWHEMEVVKLHLVWKLEKLGEMFKVLGKNSRAEKDLIKQLELDSMRVRRFREEVKQTCVRRRESNPKVVVSNRILPELWKFSYSETKSTLARLIFVFALAFDKEPSHERDSSQASTLKKEADDLPDAGTFSGCEDFTNDNDSDWSNAASPPGLDSDAEFIPVKPKKVRTTRKRKIKLDQSQPKKRKEPTEKIYKRGPYRKQPKKKKQSFEDLKCTNCPQTFQRSTTFVEHLKLQHNIQKPSFKCQICDRAFKNIYSMRVHRKSHDRPQPLRKRQRGPGPSCGMCGENMYTTWGLEAHMISEHETDEKPHYCWFCSESFSLKETRLVHRWNGRKHPARKMFKCDHVNCQESFESSDKHEEHLKSHLESTPASAGQDQEPSKTIHHCAKCNLGFFHPDILEFHELNHLDINCATFNCSKCPHSFTKKGHMVLHFKLSHLDSFKDLIPALESRKFKCDKCDYATDKNCVLQKHLKLHKDKEPVECDKCGVICHGKRAKQVHLRDQHQIPFEEYPCPVCGKSFLSALNVTTHMGDVHREKRLVCDVCSKSFTKKSSLKSHKERHHNPNRTAQHICSICGKAYMTPEGLKFHIDSIHVAEEEKGFGCPYCQKRYHREVLAKMHVKTCMKQRGLEVPTDLNEIEVEWSAAAVEEKVNKGLGRRKGKLVSGRIMKGSGDGGKSFEKFLY